jgi:SAM-dependent methyltransferase
MPIDDPADVLEQYATERNLQSRRNLYEEVDGSNAPEVLWEVIAQRRPSRVLDVGGGPGELAARMRDELGADVDHLDVSPRMVELARGRGLRAQVGDVQELPFADPTFDTVVAAWMLYHVPDVDRALAEIARVLVPGGALVAVTNSVDHLAELRELIGQMWPGFERQFNRENGEDFLRRHFAEVERRDIDLRVTVRDRERLVAYQQSVSAPTRPVPEDVALPFIVHARPVIFVATK